MFTLDSMVQRHSWNLLEDMLCESPIVVIEGARQIGKSTLAQQVAARRDALMLSLDDREVLEYAATDPQGFLAQGGERMLVVDEAQRVPELVLAVKSAVDRDRRPGRFLLTGFSDFLRVKGASDSL